MTIKYTIDVFCDGRGCLHWVHGCVSNSPDNIKLARKYAKEREGFIQARYDDSFLQDLCPECAKKPENYGEES